MRKPGQDSSTNAGRERTPKQDERVLLWQVRVTPGWRRLASDSLLAIAGVALVTGVLAAAHLYPRLPSSALTYLLVIAALASIRGHYASILAALLAFFSFNFFLALIIIFSIFSMRQQARYAAQMQSYYQIPLSTKIYITLAYFGLAAFLVVMMVYTRSLIPLSTGY